MRSVLGGMCERWRGGSNNTLRKVREVNISGGVEQDVFSVTSCGCVGPTTIFEIPSKQELRNDHNDYPCPSVTSMWSQYNKNYKYVSSHQFYNIDLLTCANRRFEIVAIQSLSSRAAV